MSIARMLAALVDERVDREHNEGFLSCDCGEIALTHDEWKKGPWITHRDFFLVAHDVKCCTNPTAEDGFDEWLSARRK